MAWEVDWRGALTKMEVGGRLLVIRSCEKEEASLLVDFAKKAFTDTFGYLYSESDLAGYLAETYTVERVCEWIDGVNDSRLMVAITAERPTNIYGYCLSGRCELPHEDATPRNGEIKKMYVGKDYLGTGVAQALFALSLKLVKEVFPDGPVYCGVWSENFRAQRFYARCGFAVCGEYLYEVGESRDREFIMRDGPT